MFLLIFGDDRPLYCDNALSSLVLILSLAQHMRAINICAKLWITRVFINAN